MYYCCVSGNICSIAVGWRTQVRICCSTSDNWWASRSRNGSISCKRVSLNLSTFSLHFLLFLLNGFRISIAMSCTCYCLREVRFRWNFLRITSLKHECSSYFECYSNGLACCKARTNSRTLWMKGVSFLRNCGAASVGEYNREIEYYQLSW